MYSQKLCTGKWSQKLGLFFGCFVFTELVVKIDRGGLKLLFDLINDAIGCGWNEIQGNLQIHTTVCVLIKTDLMLFAVFF